MRAYLRSQGVRIDPTSPAFRDAGSAVLRAHVKAYGLMLDRQEGEPVETLAPPAASKGPKLLHHASVVTIAGESYRRPDKRRAGLVARPVREPAVPARGVGQVTIGGKPKGGSDFNRR